MREIDGTPLDELARTWGDMQDRYLYPSRGEYNGPVLDCAARLVADPGGETAYVWTLGLAIMAPYLAGLPKEDLTEGDRGADVRREAEAALRAADGHLRDQPCDHDTHPYRTHEAEENDEELPGLLPRLADENAEWDENQPREEWLCPRNVAGYARIALDIIEPGQVPDVPPRLPMEDREDIDTLEGVLELYPGAGTDVASAIASQGWNLALAEPADRPGRLQAVRAVSWHAVSGMIRDKSVLDDLINSVEKVLPDFADATCDHDAHPRLSGSGTAASRLGITLSSPGGRAVYERDRHSYFHGDVPLEQVVCPVFMAEVAQETLAELREGRDRLFGPRDTSHLDAEYLRADGRLEIGKIVERLDGKSWNQKYADDLGLWAARRYDRGGRVGDRERVVLLLVAHRTMTISYPGPVLAAVEGITATMRAVAAAPRPEECAHTDAHPPLDSGKFRTDLPHFYAPDEFPPAGEVRGVESWTCPRFAAEIAEKSVERLEGLYEEDTEDEW
ncbi:hypothetical protein [Streptomyces capitiformicae]|uniref:Uncharacterized protein n=1 Tax=Streptomyces capitiformicae TaxID=2014920 RepID=A0A919GN23_9ACTN|nr:hypothetical protein [Streptomyces capitiformicae]GHH86715.1 hypothetical protein GCM10017771_24880 [Streptomyces capitiformicae]